jgi:hypothetical protein
MMAAAINQTGHNVAKSKRGRPRKPGKRTASDRLSRAVGTDLEHVEPIQVRMRMYGLSEEDARDQKAGTVVGRLQLIGVLSEAQHQAATEYLRLYEAYKRALRAPDALRNGPTAGADAQESEAYAKWCRSVIDKYTGTMGAIVVASERSRNANLYGAINSVLVKNEHWPHLFADLDVALTALVQHFGLAR